MPELTTEQLVQKVSSGLDEIKNKSNERDSTVAEVKGMAEKVSADLILLNTTITEAKNAADEHKKRIEHLESIGARHAATMSPGELKEIAMAGVQQMFEQKAADGRESLLAVGGEKIEVKSYVGADYTATDMQRGGVFVTPQMINEIVYSGLREANPLLAELLISTHGTSAPVEYFKKNGEGVGAWAGEMQDAPKGNKPKWDKGSIAMHRVTGEGACTMEILSGASIDFRATVLADIQTEIGNAVIDAYTAGSGAGKPQGFTKGAYASVNTLGATAKFDDLILIPTKLKGRYKPNAKFYLTESVLAQFLIEKSSTGEYLQVFGLNGLNNVPTLAGKGFAIIPTLATAPTSGQVALYFGDLKQAYRGVRWSGSYLKRDEITSFSNGVFEYAMAQFFGGQVVNEEAIVTLNIK